MNNLYCWVSFTQPNLHSCHRSCIDFSSSQQLQPQSIEQRTWTVYTEGSQRERRTTGNGILVQKTFYESRVDWVAPKQNPTPTVRSVQGNILFCFPYHVLDMPQPNKTFFPKRCSLSDYNFIRVSTKSPGFTDFFYLWILHFQKMFIASISWRLSNAWLFNQK